MMTKAERVVWAAATMQAVVEAFDQLKKDEVRWRKSMPGRRPVNDREVLARAIEVVAQTLSEHTDVFHGDMAYELVAKPTREYLATIGSGDLCYWRRGMKDSTGQILHPRNTMAQRKPKDLKY